MARGDAIEHSRPGWRTRDVLKAGAILFGIWILLQFFWLVRNILLVSFLGVILGIVVGAATDRLQRRRIPRAAGAAGILLLGLAILVGAGFAMAPTLGRQFGELRTRLPEVLDRVEQRLGIPSGAIGKEILDQMPKQQGAPAGQQQQQQQQPPEASPQEQKGSQESAAAGKERQHGSLRRLLSTNFGSFLNILFPVATATASLLGALVIILFVALFTAIAPELYREGLVRLVPTSERDRARDVLGALSSTLKQWAIARLLAMLAVGLVVGVSLGAIGVRAAVLLGVIAGLLELVPFFGPIASAVPAIGMALLDSPRQAVVVAIIFIVVQQLEGNLLTPLLLANRVDVPPLLTVLTVPAMTVALGVLGALIAEPLIAVVLLLVRRLWVEDHLEASSR
ncbi:MAG TPA: AI-2E family transporter [Thermoanaerobaculia bacterium]